MKIINGSTAPQGVQTLTGLVYIPPGATREVSMSASQADRARRLKFLTVEGEPVPDNVEGKLGDQVGDELASLAEELERTRAELAAARQTIAERDDEIERRRGAASMRPTYEAKHRGGGSYSILDADGAEVVEKLTKVEAEDFNAKSADDKAAYVAAVAASRK